jgi:hypothetical protein
MSEEPSAATWVKTTNWNNIVLACEAKQNTQLPWCGNIFWDPRMSHHLCAMLGHVYN